MRKLFWGYAACGVILAGGVFGTAWYAAGYPSSFVGRSLHGASHIAAHLNPLTGARKALVCMDVNGHGDVDAALACAEPLPAHDEHDPVAATTDTAPIVIRDDQDVAPIQLTVSEAPVAQSFECPPVACPGAPPTMPPCYDEETCAEETLPMPRCEEFEELHMPAEDTDVLPMPACVEEGEEVGCAGTESRKLFEFFTRFMKEQVESQKQPPIEVIEVSGPSSKSECREDVNYHRHYPGCPHTGPCMPSRPSVPCPETYPHGPCFPPSPMEPRKDDPRMESREWMRKVPFFFPGELPDRCLPVPTCDTMEFRPADGQLYDYGRGSL